MAVCEESAEESHSCPGPISHTLAMAKLVHESLENSQEISCTVDRHCRTRIFDFPGALVKVAVTHRLVTNPNR